MDQWLPVHCYPWASLTVTQFLWNSEMTLRRKLILISLNFEKYSIFHGWNIRYQIWNAAIPILYPWHTIWLHKHGLSTWFGQGHAWVRRSECSQNTITMMGNLNSYVRHMHINNSVNHEKINLLITSFGMGELRKEKLILVEHMK